MPRFVTTIDTVSLFVADPLRARTFYVGIFGVDVVYEDPTRVSLRFDNLIVNLLHEEAARFLIAPKNVARLNSDARMQISIWVESVDAICERLIALGIPTHRGLRGPEWENNRATFADPDGHNWEIAEMREN